MNTGSKILALLALTAILASCGGSSEKAAEDTKLEEDFPVAEATTDPVPAEQAASPEQPAKVDENLAATPPPAEAAPAAPYAGTGSYTVKSGDTLMKIAYENYGDIFEWRKIYAANQGAISNPMNLKAGTVLHLDLPASPVHVERNGTPFMIRRGDTLGTISGEVYGTQRKWRKLWDNNRQLIKNPNKIYAGFYLYYTMTPEDEAEKLRIRTPAQAGGDTALTPGTATSSNTTPLVTPPAVVPNGG